MAEEPQHWPTERMIAEGHTDYAVPEDLDAVDHDRLPDIAKICEVDTLAPNECIPCLAHVQYLEGEREMAEEERKNAPTVDEEIEAIRREEAETYVSPKLDALVREEEHFYTDESIRNISNVPVVERFANQVAVLQHLVEELLEGPPIPPRDVTQEELALLVVAAQRWIKITEAQGVDLAPQQEVILNATKTLVQRLHRG